MSKRERRLAAIMFTDLVGFTALGQKDEALALSVLESQRTMLRPIFKRYGGREVKTIGDSFLVDFSSALEAVKCAYEIQKTARDSNSSLPIEKQVHLRIGVHLGDVVQSAGDISGDAVNVASRIESMADDGGVCLTRQVYDHIQNKFELPINSLGPKLLKNVSLPVEVFKMQMPWDKEGTAPPAQPAQLDKTRIAVLPFANMSPDPNDSYFADGITEEIISTLSSVGGLSVISRTSVMGYKGSAKRVRDIGNELDVGSILEGSFRKAGNRVRVTAQLIAVNSDRHVWTQSYDRTLDDVFAVQTDIAKQVSDSLRVKILDQEMERIEKKPTENTKAYALYLRGRYHWNRRGVEDIKKAMEYFEQTLKEDTKFALGYVGLADCHEILRSNWGIDRRVNHEKAKSAVNKALELDDGLAEAHATLGLILMDDLEFGEAEKEFRRAVELKSSYASAHQWYFHLLRAKLRWDEALMHIEKAVELDPFSGIINANHASYYVSKRDYPKAVELQKKTVELEPKSPLGHFDLAEIYGHLNMFDEMRRECKIVVSLAQESYPYIDETMAGMVAYFKGDTETLRTLLPELESRIGQPLTANALTLAGVYFRLGDLDKGFEWLERSYKEREFNLIEIRTYFMFDGIRNDPRYLNLVNRLALN